MADTTTTTERRIERETCGRCGGSGHYSWCQRYGSTCFGCGGKGTVLTKRGVQANAFLRWLLSVPARDVVAGDVIRTEIVTAGGDTGTMWITVERVEHDVESCAAYKDNATGEWIRPRVTMLHLKGERSGFTMSKECQPDEQIRRQTSIELKRKAIAIALDYQDRLTQRGTWSKRKPSKRSTLTADERRARARARAQERRAERKAQAVELLDAHREAAQAIPHPLDWRAEQGDTLADWAHWMIQNAGERGHKQVIARLSELSD